jgi:hypothetical protein
VLASKKLGPLGSATVESVTRAQAIELIGSGTHTPRQAAFFKQQLAAAWNYGIHNDLVPEAIPNHWEKIYKWKNPLRSVGRKVAGMVRRKGEKTLDEDQIGELVRWLPNFEDDDVSDVITLYLWCAVRGSEIVGMEACEVREKKNADGSKQLWWTIPKAKTKNKNHEYADDLRVPLFGRAEKIVRRRMKETPKGYLFPRESNYTYKKESPHILQVDIGARILHRQPYCAKDPKWERDRLPDSISNWTLHDLRRTSRTMLASLECPDQIGEAILGHVDGGVKGTYQKYKYDKERITWLSKLSDHLEELAAQ